MGSLLLDQANCEKKAAATAVSLLHRFDRDRPFTLVLSRIAREELKHLELVTKLLSDMEIEPNYLPASRYAGGLRSWMSKDEPNRLVDELLVCAMIEARSCERIGALLKVLSGNVRSLYEKLHEAEDRHFEVYLERAWRLDESYASRRLKSLCDLDAELISTKDSEFRFHSGMPDLA